MLNRFKLRHRIAAGAMSLAVLGGIGVTTAMPASAAGGVTPVCYYKKVVTNPGSTFVPRVTVYNVLERTEYLQYPARTKRCFITQTKETDATGFAPRRQVIWTGSILVKY